MKMYYFLFIILFSCKNNAESNNRELKGLKVNPEMELKKNKGIEKITKTISYNLEDSVVLIILRNDISFHWDNQKGEIVNDNLYKNLSNKFKIYRNTLLELIDDTKTTKAIDCYQERFLTIGDLSFVLLTEFENIPYFKVFGIQFDSYDKQGCYLPSGIFDYIEINRDVVKSDLKKYFESLN